MSNNENNRLDTGTESGLLLDNPNLKVKKGIPWLSGLSKKIESILDFLDDNVDPLLTRACRLVVKPSVFLALGSLGIFHYANSIGQETMVREVVREEIQLAMTQARIEDRILIQNIENRMMANMHEYTKATHLSCSGKGDITYFQDGRFSSHQTCHSQWNWHPSWAPVVERYESLGSPALDAANN